MAISALEAAHRAASDVEQVAWVDRDDRMLGALPRHELREKGLIGRGTFILLFNSAGELCIHQRTLSKALYPGFWDVAAGGMVGANETYAHIDERYGFAGVGGVCLACGLVFHLLDVAVVSGDQGFATNLVQRE